MQIRSRKTLISLRVLINKFSFHIREICVECKWYSKWFKIKFICLRKWVKWEESTKLKNNFNTYIYLRNTQIFYFSVYHFSSIIVNDHKFIHFIVFFFFTTNIKITIYNISIRSIEIKKKNYTICSNINENFNFILKIK